MDAELLTPTDEIHPMPGFERIYATPTDYILGITEDIWEGHDLERIRQTYAPDVRVESPQGVANDVEAVIAATAATFIEFPDRENLGEDVIWSDDGEGGFLSSHRILSTATHTGAGSFGTATGTRLHYRVIADCAARDNLIYDEWLVRDRGAIVRQLGTTPQAFAQAEIDQGAAVSPGPDRPVRYVSAGNRHPAGVAYRNHVAELMGQRHALSQVRYDRAVRAELPGGSTAYGIHDASAFWIGLGAAFPGADFTVVHQIGRADVGRAPRAALRWEMRGTHGGDGMFGPPTGAEVHVMGLSHAEFGPRGIATEWVVLDEVAIWRQILTAA